MKIEQDGVQTNTTSIPFEVRSTRGVLTFGEVYRAVQGTVWLNGAMLLGPDNVWEGFDEQRDYREDTGLRVEKSTGRWATYTDNVPTLEQATGAPAPNTVSGIRYRYSHPHSGRSQLLCTGSGQRYFGGRNQAPRGCADRAAEGAARSRGSARRMESRVGADPQR